MGPRWTTNNLNSYRQCRKKFTPCQLRQCWVDKVFEYISAKSTLYSKQIFWVRIRGPGGYFWWKKRLKISCKCTFELYMKPFRYCRCFWKTILPDATHWRTVTYIRGWMQMGLTPYDLFSWNIINEHLNILLMVLWRCSLCARWFSFVTPDSSFLFRTREAGFLKSSWWGAISPGYWEFGVGRE
jgi:hypothetical protein